MGQLAVTAEKYVQLRVGSYVFNFLYSTPPIAVKSKTPGPSGGPCTLHIGKRNNMHLLLLLLQEDKT
jgi:hypothetical protein